MRGGYKKKKEKNLESRVFSEEVGIILLEGFGMLEKIYIEIYMCNCHVKCTQVIMFCIYC